MGRKRSSGGGESKAKGAPGSSVDRIERYEDTIEKGGVDDFMFKRDQIMFNPQDDSDGADDVNEGQGEAVLGLDMPEREDDEEEDEDEGEWPEEATKVRKQKSKPDLSTKGRFGKDDDSDDFEEEEENDSAAESDEDEEGWGRQYYSRPSARRERERDDVYDEKREEERELEEKEVRRLQRKARESIRGAEDWGLDDVEVEVAAPKADDDEDVQAEPVPAPQTADPAALIRHLQFHEPLKLALARDLPLVVRKLKKTARGIQKMEAEATGEETLHKGLGWLHYQTLLTYATTLAFYIHLCALPVDQRPDIANHPIMARLLQLKEGVEALESLDFAAGSVSDPGVELYVRPGMDELDDEDEAEMEAMMAAKRDLIGRMLQNGGDALDDEDGSDDDEDDDMADSIEFNEEDAQNLWNADSFDDNELEDLLQDQEQEVSVPVKKQQKSGKRERSRKSKKSSTAEDADAPLPSASFTPIAEPTFVASTKKRSKNSKSIAESDETLGDMLELEDADAGDKERRKKSLRFHTSRIAAMSARRSAARERRLGGDDDVPYRDRQAARDAALRKNGPKGNGDEGEDLDGSDWTESDRKRAREVRDEAEDDVQEEAHDDDGYYDLVKRRKVAKEEAKAAAHEEFMDDKFASFEDETADGPRAINRAIEKNRGLTPRRSKTGRNPRVKKRQAYEKAKQKVGSQRAVFKGGQAALSGSYSGEKSGISTVVKSRKF